MNTIVLDNIVLLAFVKAGREKNGCCNQYFY